MEKYTVIAVKSQNNVGVPPEINLFFLLYSEWLNRDKPDQNKSIKRPHLIPNYSN